MADVPHSELTGIVDKSGNKVLSGSDYVVKNDLNNEMLDMGYTQLEIQSTLPNPILSYTIRDVLNCMATRRLSPRYDQASDTIICDGIEQPVSSLDSIDGVVQ
jgi:hypothetical protein